MEVVAVGTVMRSSVVRLVVEVVVCCRLVAVAVTAAETLLCSPVVDHIVAEGTAVAARTVAVVVVVVDAGSDFPVICCVRC